MVHPIIIIRTNAAELNARVTLKGGRLRTAAAAATTTRKVCRVKRWQRLTTISRC